MSLIKKIYRKLVPTETLVKVYSHPRSGTHFMEAFLAKNFYPNKDLNIEKVTWGHWSNRQVKEEGNPYGKLFGSHSFPARVSKEIPKIYIIRDPRAVAYSTWKTKNFVHPEKAHLSFSEFLKTPLDWRGTPAKRTEIQLTIFEHWKEHTEAWKSYAAEDENTLFVTYEGLKDHPFQEYNGIYDAFFPKTKKRPENQIDPISKPLGLLPNKGTKNAWQEVFSEEDVVYYNAIFKNK